MNAQSHIQTDAAAAAILSKVDQNSPALVVTGRAGISVKAGTVFGGRAFDVDTPVQLPAIAPLSIGDYMVILDNGSVVAVPMEHADLPANVLGGFHFAPGGNASARAGGDDIPAINPFSLWDRKFRPACPDPRGMTLVEAAGKKFWVDIYLTAADHLANGTSRFGAKIADGDDPPENPAGGRFKRFDYATACAVMAHHGKALPSFEDFIAAAFGVTEKTAADDEPELTALDAPRTSKFGLMQITGNMWQWGHDGDPDNPRASIFGGSWLDGEYAGSRYAVVAFNWPGDSDGSLGARGRSDHLQPE